MGSVVGSWYRVVDLEDDGCRNTGYRGENFDDQTRIFLLEDGNRVPRVQTTLLSALGHCIMWKYSYHNS